MVHGFLSDDRHHRVLVTAGSSKGMNGMLAVEQAVDGNPAILGQQQT
jgi:hypothetical protein